VESRAHKQHATSYLMTQVNHVLLSECNYFMLAFVWERECPKVCLTRSVRLYSNAVVLRDLVGEELTLLSSDCSIYISLQRTTWSLRSTEETRMGNQTFLQIPLAEYHSYWTDTDRHEKRTSVRTFSGPQFLYVPFII
jgi:hypothetical protein